MTENLRSQDDFIGGLPKAESDTADKSQSSRHIPCAVHLEFH